MAIINLRDYYPFYTSDCFMEVSEEVAEMFKEFDRKEAAYRLRTYRHKAYYSLDRDDGLEHEAVFVALSPHELYGFALWEWAPKLLSASEAWKDDSYEICEKPVQVIIKRFYEHEAGTSLM